MEQKHIMINSEIQSLLTSQRIIVVNYCHVKKSEYNFGKIAAFDTVKILNATDCPLQLTRGRPLMISREVS